MAAPAYLLDTNILLRISRRDDPDHAIVDAALANLAGAGSVLHYTRQTIAEFWNVATRPADRNGFGLKPLDANREVRVIEAGMVLLPDSEAVYHEWRRLVAVHGISGVQVHDARLIPATGYLGIKQSLTDGPCDQLGESTGAMRKRPRPEGLISLIILLSCDSNFRMPVEFALRQLSPSAPDNMRQQEDDTLVLTWLHGRSRHTERAYQADVARFRARAGKPLLRVTLADLQEFAGSLQDLRPASRHRMLSSVKSLLGFGCRLGYLPLDVGRALRLPPLPTAWPNGFCPKATSSASCRLRQMPATGRR